MMMREIITVTICLVILSGCSILTRKSGLVTTVENVDLHRYLGKWYQLAYFPNRFQPDDCALVTAEYSLDEKDRIIVVNTCWNDREMQEVKREIRGRAFRTKDSARLKVQFFWPIRAPYWIIGLDQENYSYAVVGGPSMRYLWILTRQPVMSQELFSGIVGDLQAMGYDMEKLKVTGEIIP